MRDAIIIIKQVLCFVENLKSIILLLDVALIYLINQSLLAVVDRTFRHFFGTSIWLVVKMLKDTSQVSILLAVILIV